MIGRLTGIATALLVAGASGAAAQSAAGFAADPNAETNQIPSPSNTQPADPGAGSYRDARTPTDPQKHSDRTAPGRFDIGPTQTYAMPLYGPPYEQD